MADQVAYHELGPASMGGVYPINADKSKASASYISHLEARTFQPIGRFLKKEIKAYGYQQNTPIKFKLHPEVTEIPPEPPMDGKIWRIILWSLKLRLWASSGRPAG